MTNNHHDYWSFFVDLKIIFQNVRILFYFGRIKVDIQFFPLDKCLKTNSLVINENIIKYVE